jgi:hypothetical protein
MSRLGLLFLFLTPGFLAAQSPDEIIGQYYKVVSKGDVRNWEKVRSVYWETWSSFAEIDARGATPKLPPKSLGRFYAIWPDRSLAQVFDDSTSLALSIYHIGKERIVIFTDMPPMYYQNEESIYEPFFQFDPVIIEHARQKSKSILLKGVREFDSLKCYDIEIQTKVLTWHFYFNVDSRLLEFWTNSPTGDTSIVTKVFNYKSFDGFLIPMSEIKTRNGVTFFWSNRRKLVLNATIDPEKFNYKSKN